jgi:hypothetical protein
VEPQKTAADRMKCSRPGQGGRLRCASGAVAASFGKDLVGPPRHLECGAPSEGQQQQTMGIGTVQDQMRDPMSERLCLAGAPAPAAISKAGGDFVSPPMPYSTALRCAKFRSRRCR